MKKNNLAKKLLTLEKTTLFYLLFFFLFLTANSVSALQTEHYLRWKSVGEKIGAISLNFFNYSVMSQPYNSNIIVLSNAGYAEVSGESTEPILDGLSASIGLSRGSGTLIEVHSVYDDPLWVSVYDKVSGYCFYCVINPDEINSIKKGNQIKAWNLFSQDVVEKINSEYLFQYPEKWPVSFGSNAFRIVTISNGIALNVPFYAVRSFEFHDHYCPGVSSGLLMANFVKKYFKDSGKGAFFVQGLQPWCKEDALMVILNATPGKTGYSVNYATGDNISKWVFPDAHNIIYHQNEKTGLWEGVILQFVWGDTSHCNKYNDADKKTGGAAAKLCADIWYLERLNIPEEFVKPIYKFTLEKGKSPKDYAKPGFDIMLPENLPLGARI